MSSDQQGLPSVLIKTHISLSLSLCSPCSISPPSTFFPPDVLHAWSFIYYSLPTTRIKLQRVGTLAISFFALCPSPGGWCWESQEEDQVGSAGRWYSFECGDFWVACWIFLWMCPADRWGQMSLELMGEMQLVELDLIKAIGWEANIQEEFTERGKSGWNCTRHKYQSDIQDGLCKICSVRMEGMLPPKPWEEKLSRESEEIPRQGQKTSQLKRPSWFGN